MWDSYHDKRSSLFRKSDCYNKKSFVELAPAVMLVERGHLLQKINGQGP